MSSRYEALKVYAAGVGSFDFELDYEFYEAVVKGKIKTAKRLADKRLSAAEEKGAKVLGPKAIADALRASDRAYKAFLKANPEWLKPKAKPKVKKKAKR